MSQDCARASRFTEAARPGRIAQGAQRTLGAAEAFFVRHRHRLVWVHVVMFLAFVGLIFAPPLGALPAPQDGPLDNYRLFANLLLWGLWFPLVFVSVIFTGRSWCGLLCPMGAASEWANKKGLKRAIPAWLQWPGTPVVSFIVITIWAQTLGARDHAETSALLFGGVMALAIVVGFVWGRNKRAWCRHACPIGLLLGVYSRLGMVDFRPTRPRAGGDTWTEATACPTMIDLKRKTETRHCIECFRCVHPNTQGGLRLAVRRPGVEIEEIAGRNPNLSEVLFLFLGNGVALGGFLWLVLDNYQSFRLWLATSAIKSGWLWVGEPGPSWLMAVFPAEREVFRWVDFITITGYMMGWMMLSVVVLSLTTGWAAWLAGRLGGTGTWSRRFVELGYQIAPVAMVSLVLGLGGELFSVLSLLGLSADDVRLVKSVLFALSAVWSLWLGWRILAHQGVASPVRFMPLAGGAVSIAFVGAAWYPAVFSL